MAMRSLRLAAFAMAAVFARPAAAQVVEPPITDLRLVRFVPGDVQVGLTMPSVLFITGGSAVSRFAFKYSLAGPITDDNWLDAAQVHDLGSATFSSATPGEPAEEKLLLADGVDFGSLDLYWVAAKYSYFGPPFYDEVWSDVSNNAQATFDTVAPNTVTDLSAFFVSPGVVRLTFTAPRDDANSAAEGPAWIIAAAYSDHAPASDPGTWWNTGAPPSGSSFPPVAVDTPQEGTIWIPSGLTEVYIAIRAFDESNLAGGMSNVAVALRHDAPAPPGSDGSGGCSSSAPLTAGSSILGLLILGAARRN